MNTHQQSVEVRTKIDVLIFLTIPQCSTASNIYLVQNLPFYHYMPLHNFIFTFLNLMQILDWLILAVSFFPLSGDRELTTVGNAKG